MGIVQSMLDIVEKQAEIHGARKVVRINLEFGTLTGVLPAAVSFAFEVLSKGGITEGAALGITIIPLKVFCSECGKEMILEDYRPLCPECESGVLTFLEGRDEMRIASLEIE